MLKFRKGRKYVALIKPKGKKAKEKPPTPYQWENRVKSRKKGSNPEPESLAKLKSFLEDQNQWLAAFVSETDERRFEGAEDDSEEIENGQEEEDMDDS